jgi:hypothetical protein
MNSLTNPRPKLAKYTHIEADRLVQITHLIYLIDFKIFPGILNSNRLIKSYRQKDMETYEVFNVLSGAKWRAHTSEFMRFIEQTIEKIKKKRWIKLFQNN